MTPPASSGSLVMSRRAESTAPSTWNHADWRVSAECASLETAIFFPDPDGADYEGAVLDAKAICAACPVRNDCLEFAIRTRQDDGVWGGATPEERRSIRRRRRRQALKNSQAA
jgi:WhiB family transcriptional regulator, redox-sensing transcriptional regulator